MGSSLQSALLLNLFNYGSTVPEGLRDGLEARLPGLSAAVVLSAGNVSTPVLRASTTRTLTLTRTSDDIQAISTSSRWWHVEIGWRAYRVARLLHVGLRAGGRPCAVRLALPRLRRIHLAASQYSQINDALVILVCDHRAGARNM